MVFTFQGISVVVSVLFVERVSVPFTEEVEAVVVVGVEERGVSSAVMLIVYIPSCA